MSPRDHLRLAVRARRAQRTRHADALRRAQRLVAYHHDVTAMQSVAWGDPCPVCVERAPTPELLAFAARHTARPQ